MLFKDADDTFLLTYCPTLFVVGERALDCDTVEIQKLASRMRGSQLISENLHNLLIF